MSLIDATSTHMLSMIAAVYGVFIYSISFSLEMWFVVTSPQPTSTSQPSRPPPAIITHSWSEYNPSAYRSQFQQERSPFRAYSTSGTSGDDDTEYGGTSSPPIFPCILAALYFIIVMVSLLLILGIIIRSMMCITVWLITIVVMLLPEGGLVGFVTLYTWGIDSRNGQIELCFYVIRVILNVFFVFCVITLLSHWKSEKQASKFAFNLNTYNSYAPPFTSPSLSSTSGRHHLSSVSGMVPSLSPYIDTTCSTTVNPMFKFATLRGSQFDTRNFPSLTGLYGGYDSSGGDSGVTDSGLDGIDYFQLLHHNYPSLGIRSAGFSDDSHVYLGHQERETGSLKLPKLNKSKKDGGKKSATSKSSSSSTSYSTQSLDRRKVLKDRSKRGVGGILKIASFKEDITLRPLSTKPFDYLSRPGSTMDVTDCHDDNVDAGGEEERDRGDEEHDPSNKSRSHDDRSKGVYSSQTLPRDFETTRGSTQSIRDVAL